jgi:hypothetical protein
MNKDVLTRVFLATISGSCAQALTQPNLPMWANILLTGVITGCGALSPSAMRGAANMVRRKKAAPKLVDPEAVTKPEMPPVKP